MTGFPPGVATSYEINTASAIACKSDASITYGQCVSLLATKVLSAVPLGGLTLTAGDYRFATMARLNSVLKLNSSGKSTSQFIIKISPGLAVTPN